MSCIIGLADGDTVFMIGDAFGQGPTGALAIKAEPKVAINGEFLIGASGSTRYGQALRHFFEPPKPSVGQDPLNFMVRDFVPRMQQCLEENEQSLATRIEDESSALVGFRGSLFVVEPNLHVSEARPIGAEDYGVTAAAIGSGGLLALGSIFVQDDIYRGKCYENPRLLLRRAMQAPLHLSASVYEPFTVIELRNQRHRSGKKTPNRASA